MEYAAALIAALAPTEGPGFRGSSRSDDDKLLLTSPMPHSARVSSSRESKRTPSTQHPKAKKISIPAWDSGRHAAPALLLSPLGRAHAPQHPKMPGSWVDLERDPKVQLEFEKARAYALKHGAEWEAYETQGSARFKPRVADPRIGWDEERVAQVNRKLRNAFALRLKIRQNRKVEQWLATLWFLFRKQQVKGRDDLYEQVDALVFTDYRAHHMRLSKVLYQDWNKPMAEALAWQDWVRDIRVRVPSVWCALTYSESSSSMHVSCMLVFL
jgi:hypothetical protein